MTDKRRFELVCEAGRDAVSSPIKPVWLRLKDARMYLSMGKNSFNKYIRPHLKEIKIGRNVFFEVLDLDHIFGLKVDSICVHYVHTP